MPFSFTNEGGLVVLESMFTFIRDIVAEEVTEFLQDEDYTIDDRHDDETFLTNRMLRRGVQIENRINIPLEINRCRVLEDVSGIGDGIGDCVSQVMPNADLSVPSEIFTPCSRSQGGNSYPRMTNAESSTSCELFAPYNAGKGNTSYSQLSKQPEVIHTKKGYRPQVHKAGKRSRRSRGLPGKVPKKTQEGGDLWLSLAGLSLDNYAAEMPTEEKKPRWKMNRPSRRKQGRQFVY